MSAIIIGLFLFALDNTILADVQPKIATEFGAVNRVAWLAVAFMIPTLALMLPNGQLFQTFNIKWLYIAGVVTFEIGSAICGAAPTMTVLIFGRAIAGVGCTLIYTGSLMLITINTTERERYISGLRGVNVGRCIWDLWGRRGVPARFWDRLSEGRWLLVMRVGDGRFTLTFPSAGLLLLFRSS
jgi:MFS family permease